MDNKNILLASVLFLIIGFMFGLLTTYVVFYNDSNVVYVEEITDEKGNVVGGAIREPVADLISPPPVPPEEPPTVPRPPSTPVVGDDDSSESTSHSSGGGRVVYTYAGSLNYCVDENSVVVAFRDWSNEIKNMDLGLHTYTVKLSSHIYYLINFCKVNVGEYEKCNQCWAELNQ